MNEPVNVLCADMTRQVVLLTGPALQPFRGGIQTHAKTLLSAFAASRRIELRFAPTTLGLHDQESWLKKGLRFMNGLGPFVNSLRSADALHLNSTFDARSIIRDGIYLLISRYLLRKPVILQFHGGSPGKLNLDSHRFLRNALGWLLTAADRILILSRVQGYEFGRLFPLIKFDLVPNCIDCSDAPKSSPFVPKDTFRFLYLGRLAVGKGIPEIIGASCLLRKKGLRFTVSIYGDGPLRDWLAQEISRIGIGDCVEYGGVVTGVEKAGVIEIVDAMLLPSSAEAFPYSMLEAFKYSLPLIASPVGAIEDILVDGENGLIVPPGDTNALARQMEYAVNHPHEMHAMGVFANRQVNRDFSIEVHRRRFEELYGSVICRAQDRNKHRK